MTIGVAAGVALTFLAGRLVASLLFGLAPSELPTAGAALAVMGLASAGAAYLPTRRVSRVDPTIALRLE